MEQEQQQKVVDANLSLPNDEYKDNTVTAALIVFFFFCRQFFQQLLL